MKSHETRTAFKDSGRIVIVGASLAGLCAVERHLLRPLMSNNYRATIGLTRLVLKPR